MEHLRRTASGHSVSEQSHTSSQVSIPTNQLWRVGALNVFFLFFYARNPALFAGTHSIDSSIEMCNAD